MRSAFSRSIRICPAIVVLFSTIATANINVTGSLSTPTGVLVDNEPSAQHKWTGFTIAWDISQVGSHWFYKYTISSDAAGTKTLKPGLSHFILEVSSTFTAANWWGFSSSVDSTAVADYNAAGPGNSNPAWPGGTVHGGKLNTDGDELTFSFTSNRAPQWSDFYAKGGNYGVAYNASWGATAANKTNYTAATALDSSGGTLYKVLAPDTQTVVPAPAAPVLALVGLAVVGSIRRRLT